MTLLHIFLLSFFIGFLRKWSYTNHVAIFSEFWPPPLNVDTYFYHYNVANFEKYSTPFPLVATWFKYEP